MQGFARPRDLSGRVVVEVRRANARLLVWEDSGQLNARQTLDASGRVIHSVEFDDLRWRDEAPKLPGSCPKVLDESTDCVR